MGAPAADLDACDDVWVRPPLESCKGPVLVVPAAAAKRINEIPPQQADVGGPLQKYTLLVKLWSTWQTGDGREGELPAQVYENWEPDADIEGEEDAESESGEEDEEESYSDNDDDDDEPVMIRRR